MSFRTISAPSGIGDLAWLIMKLISTGEKFHWELPDGQPQRGKQVFDLLPQLTASCKYVPRLSYSRLERGNIQRFRPYFKKITDRRFMLSANKWLEQGRRIEGFFPDLETKFILPWVTTEEDKEQADKYFIPGTKDIGIYGSSYSTSRAWGFWQADKWFEFIKLMNAADTGCSFVILGADWDLDLSGDLIKLITEHNKSTPYKENILYQNTVGEPLSVVIEILRRLDLFCGFPSGLSILNETLPAKATLMFYPPHLELLMNTWADPKRIESGEYIPLLFFEPDEAYGHIRHLIEEVDEMTPPPMADIQKVADAFGVDVPEFANRQEEVIPMDELIKPEKKIFKRKPNEKRLNNPK